MTLNDVLLTEGGARFTVQGRAADLVKVGGKRSSLSALSAELNRVPGVLDGVFWLPEVLIFPASPRSRWRRASTKPKSWRGCASASIQSSCRGR